MQRPCSSQVPAVRGTGLIMQAVLPLCAHLRIADAFLPTLSSCICRAVRFTEPQQAALQKIYDQVSSRPDRHDHVSSEAL